MQIPGNRVEQRKNNPYTRKALRFLLGRPSFAFAIRLALNLPGFFAVSEGKQRFEAAPL